VLNSPEVITGDQHDGATAAKGAIEFRNVSFAYPGSEAENVLQNISFRVEPGETLGIIGATASGKSTLMHLIPRFYDATEGEVLVDGVNVKDYDLTALREKIAIVLQKAELYSRSIADNISWAKNDATPWEIKKAAEIAQADDFICGKSGGYYTPVTEGGHSLSGGQKQRISIARALLKEHEILIFDDSTSPLTSRPRLRCIRRSGRTARMRPRSSSPSASPPSGARTASPCWTTAG
ncbi:MAG: ABC transporter ATP-binding protein, partial [Clostridia bacterium]|nr:ABC transporter ATP-binding protein [Clostridia bacterium]